MLVVVVLVVGCMYVSKGVSKDSLLRPPEGKGRQPVRACGGDQPGMSDRDHGGLGGWDAETKNPCKCI